MDGSGFLWTPVDDGLWTEVDISGEWTWTEVDFSGLTSFRHVSHRPSVGKNVSYLQSYHLAPQALNHA